MLALALPPCLFLVNDGLGLHFVERAVHWLRDLPGVGGLATRRVGGTIAFYSWPPRSGDRDPSLAIFALYPLTAALFAATRRLRQAISLLVLPVLPVWVVVVRLRT